MKNALVGHLDRPPAFERILFAGLIGAALTAALVLAWNRAFQVDEVESIHAAYNIAAGKLIYRDFWQGHNPGLYLLLAPLLPTDDPTLAFRVARLVSFGLFAATVSFATATTRALGGLGRWTAALLLLHTTFVERGLEVRPDTLMVCLVTAALYVGARDRENSVPTVALQGLLLGLAFLATQKAAIASFAFGLCWLVIAFQRRRLEWVVVPCVVWALPYLGLLAALHGVEALPAYVEYNLRHPGESVAGGGAAAAGIPTLGPIFVEGWRNAAFLAAAIASLIFVSLKRLVGRTMSGVEAPVVLAVVWTAGLFVMAFPYPYSHVGGLPAWAILIGVAAAPVRSRLTAAFDGVGLQVALAAATIAALTLVLATSGPRLFGEHDRVNDYQLHLLGRVQSLTRPEDPVFDLAGLYFREDAYPVYLMTGAHYLRYRNGDYPRIAPSLKERGLAAFIVNYRLRWLGGEDRAFLQGHFVRVEPNIFLSGSDLAAFTVGSEKSFEVTRGADYRFDGDGELWVDGRPFESGRLERGTHRLTSPSGIANGRLVLSQAPPMPDVPIADRAVYYAFD